LHLYNWGEPLLHKNIVEMIRLAAATGARTYLSTNLNPLKPGMAEPLVRSGLHLLNASIDGTTQESYAAYRRGGDLERVLSNLRELVAARSRAPEVRLRIRWQFVVNRQNEGEIDRARRMAADIGLEFRVHRLHVGLDAYDEQTLAERTRRDAEWLPADAGLSRYGKGRPNALCGHLWDRTIVNFNGSVSPCCQVFEPQHAFAERFEADFGRIWNGPAYAAARAFFASGHVTSETERLVCHRCARLGNVL